ncbi:MAG: Alginate lyase [Oscillospiraceae bacterium]|jgi:hypothetical protein
MNQQLPGYSAVYPPAGPCTSSAKSGMQNTAMTIQVPSQTPVEASASGSAAQSSDMAAAPQSSAIPSAIQQPGIQQAALGTTSQAVSSAQQMMPITDTTQPAPMTADSLEFLNGFLRTQIGRKVRIEFLIGTNTFTDKSGTLIGVGANYILLRQADSDDILTCDFFNIKFVTIFY